MSLLVPKKQWHLASDDKQRSTLSLVLISEEQDEWIRLEIHKLTVDRRPLSEVLLDIDALERRVVEAIGAEEFAADLLSVRRVLARLRLVRAVELRGDGPLAKALFEQAVSLGFRTGDDRVGAAALLSRICLARGCADLLRGELEEALAQLDQAPSVHDLELAAEVRAARGAK
jgi:hypothetical protein